MKDLLRDALKAQILFDGANGDTTVLAEILSNISDEVIFNSLSEDAQEQLKSYYEIHVNHGKHGYSFAIVVPYEMEEQRIIDLAIEQDLFNDEDDYLYIDYITELDFDEWDTHFNFNKD